MVISPKHKMTSLCEHNAFNREGNVPKLLYLYENVILKNKSDEVKADNLVTYLSGKAFDYYLHNFTVEYAPSLTA